MMDDIEWWNYSDKPSDLLRLMRDMGMKDPRITVPTPEVVPSDNSLPPAYHGAAAVHDDEQ